VYLDAGADFSGYERVVIDPVVIFRSDPARFAGIPSAQLDALASEFRAELVRAFGAEFAVADAAGGPGPLRVRAALTAAIARGSNAEHLQYIEVELELRDAATEARLGAAVDSRGKRPSSASDTSQGVDAKEVFNAWAEQAAVRVAALRDVDRS